MPPFSELCDECRREPIAHPMSDTQHASLCCWCYVLQGGIPDPSHPGCVGAAAWVQRREEWATCKRVLRETFEPPAAALVHTLTRGIWTINRALFWINQRRRR